MKNEMTKDKFTYDHIFGSGFSQFPWYTEVDYDEEKDVLLVTIEDDDERTHARLTSADLWKSFQALLRTNEVYFSSPDTLKEYEDIDLDAGDTDCIVQKAVLGEVVYG